MGYKVNMPDGVLEFSDYTSMSMKRYLESMCGGNFTDAFIEYYLNSREIKIKEVYENDSILNNFRSSNLWLMSDETFQLFVYNNRYFEWEKLCNLIPDPQTNIIYTIKMNQN